MLSDASVRLYVRVSFYHGFVHASSSFAFGLFTACAALNFRHPQALNPKACIARRSTERADVCAYREVATQWLDMGVSEH